MANSSISQRFLNAFADMRPPQAKHSPYLDETQEANLHSLKAIYLNHAREAATEAGATHPDLETYRVGFTQSPEIKHLIEIGRIKPENVDAIAADLSGQNLNGFKLTEPKAMEEFHRRQFEQGKHDLLGQDNDHLDVTAVSPFYDRIQLTGATLDGAWVEPASSFNDQIAKATSRNNMTFHGLADGETFTFPAGKSTDINVTGIDNGVIVFAKGAHAESVYLEGSQAQIEIGAHASVSDLSSSKGFKVVRLDMAPGAELSKSDLRDTHVSMASTMQGSKLKDVRLGENVTGLDFSGAQINNLSIGNEAITDPSQLKAHGINVDANTHISASPEFIAQRQMEVAQQAAASVIAAFRNNPAPNGASSVDFSALGQKLAALNPADTSLDAAQRDGGGAKVAEMPKPEIAQAAAPSRSLA